MRSTEFSSIDSVSGTQSLCARSHRSPEDASTRSTPIDRLRASETDVADRPCLRMTSVMVAVSSLCCAHFVRTVVTTSRSDSAWIRWTVHGRVCPNRWIRWMDWMRSLNENVRPT